jgi:hypothetical protein
LPAFWLATPSGRLFPPDVGPKPAGAPGAMILKDRNAPTTRLSAAKGKAQGLTYLGIYSFRALWRVWGCSRVLAAEHSAAGLRSGLRLTMETPTKEKKTAEELAVKAKGK